MIDAVKLRMKKDKEVNYILSESLRKAWITFEPMLTHVIQLLQCGLHTRCPICFVKLLKIWFDFHHVQVQIKHVIVSLLIGDIMCPCSPNTYTLPLKNWQLAQRNISDYMVPHCWCIHMLPREKHMLEKFVISLHANASAIHPSILALLRIVYLSFFLILFLDYTSTWTAQVLQPWLPKVNALANVISHWTIQEGILFPSCIQALQSPNQYFSSEFYCSTHMNVEFSMGRMQQEKTELNWARRQPGWSRSVAARPHFAPKNSEFSPKIPL
jgi:hypothetical protein